MTDAELIAELIARLRDGCNLQQRDGERAANRIEALTKERDEADDLAKAAFADGASNNIRLAETSYRVKWLEAKLAKAVARLKKECGFFVHCYWDADDREIGHFDICEILDAYDFGTVAEIEHVAVIATTFEAQLPPADDSETDDFFEVCEHTREAAEAKVAAEISRRATLTQIKGESHE